MAKPFKTLRKKMSPAAQARAKEQTARIADPCGQRRLTLKGKGVSKNNVSKAAVLVLIAAISSTLTGWGFTGNSTKAKSRRVTNQTKAFQVVNAETVRDELKLTFKDISEKSCSKSELDRQQQENDWTYRH